MKLVLSFVIVLLLIAKLDAQEVTTLKLKQAFKYEDNRNVPEFSGLCLKDGSLYSVNDKDDDYLYRLKVDTLHSTFSAKGPVISEGNDFEGVRYFNHSFYAVDERQCRIYKVIENKAVPYSKEFLSSLKARNLIDCGQHHNKQIESFALINDSTFLIATERGITTLAIIDIHGNVHANKVIAPIHYPDSYLPEGLTKQSQEEKDTNSFSDLCIYKGKAYLLERKKKMIYVVDYADDSFKIEKALSFKNSIPASEEYHPYYGAAEGLAVDDHYFYIILDNNKIGEQQRKQMNDKTRHTLFQFYKGDL